MVSSIIQKHLKSVKIVGDETLAKVSDLRREVVGTKRVGQRLDPAGGPSLHSVYHEAMLQIPNIGLGYIYLIYPFSLFSLG